MKQFIRDTSVHIEVTFKSDSGALITGQTGVTLTINYIPLGGGDTVYQTYNMVKDTSSPSQATWTLDWDSSVADPGVVSAHAETQGLAQRAVVDLEFRLTANRANRELVGE